MCVTIFEQASQCQLGSDALYSIVPLIPAIAGFLCPDIEARTSVPCPRCRQLAATRPAAALAGDNSRDTQIQDTPLHLPLKDVNKISRNAISRETFRTFRHVCVYNIVSIGLKFVLPFSAKSAPPPLPLVSLLSIGFTIGFLNHGEGPSRAQLS